MQRDDDDCKKEVKSLLLLFKFKFNLLTERTKMKTYITSSIHLPCSMHLNLIFYRLVHLFSKHLLEAYRVEALL